MFTKTVTVSVLTAALLSGCAMFAPKPRPLLPPSAATIMDEADMAIRAGRNEEGIAILKTATIAFPGDKAAWRRIAQVAFEMHNYGPAIYHAQQAIERDPDDLVAHSIVAASGLRVSSKALADLVQKNKLTGTVREEAQDLARLLRASIGADIIVPNPAARDKPKPRMGRLPLSLAATPHKPEAGDPLEQWLNK